MAQLDKEKKTWAGNKTNTSPFFFIAVSGSTTIHFVFFFCFDFERAQKKKNGSPFQNWPEP